LYSSPKRRPRDQGAGNLNFDNLSGFRFARSRPAGPYRRRRGRIWGKTAYACSIPQAPMHRAKNWRLGVVKNGPRMGSCACQSHEPVAENSRASIHSANSAWAFGRSAAVSGKWGPVDQSSFRPFQRPPTRLGDPQLAQPQSCVRRRLRARPSPSQGPAADVEAFPPAARISRGRSPLCRHASLPVSLLLPAYRLKDARGLQPTIRTAAVCKKGLRRNQSGHRGANN